MHRIYDLIPVNYGDCKFYHVKIQSYILSYNNEALNFIGKIRSCDRKYRNVFKTLKAFEALKP